MNSDELLPITREKRQRFANWYYDLCLAEQAERDYFKSRRENP